MLNVGFCLIVYRSIQDQFEFRKCFFTSFDICFFPIIYTSIHYHLELFFCLRDTYKATPVWRSV